MSTPKSEHKLTQAEIPELAITVVNYLKQLDNATQSKLPIIEKLTEFLQSPKGAAYFRNSMAVYASVKEKFETLLKTDVNIKPYYEKLFGMTEPIESSHPAEKESKEGQPIDVEIRMKPVNAEKSEEIKVAQPISKSSTQSHSLVDNLLFAMFASSIESFKTGILEAKTPTGLAQTIQQSLNTEDKTVAKMHMANVKDPFMYLLSLFNLGNIATITNYDSVTGKSAQQHTYVINLTSNISSNLGSGNMGVSPNVGSGNMTVFPNLINLFDQFHLQGETYYTLADSTKILPIRLRHTAPLTVPATFVIDGIIYTLVSAILALPENKLEDTPTPMTPTPKLEDTPALKFTAFVKKDTLWKNIASEQKSFSEIQSDLNSYGYLLLYENIGKVTTPSDNSETNTEGVLPPPTPTLSYHNYDFNESTNILGDHAESKFTYPGTELVFSTVNDFVDFWKLLVTSDHKLSNQQAYDIIYNEADGSSTIYDQTLWDADKEKKARILGRLLKLQSNKTIADIFESNTSDEIVGINKDMSHESIWGDVINQHTVTDSGGTL